MAAVAGVAVSFLTKLLSFGSLVTAWERTREGAPWAIMTFAVAYAVAALADDEPDEFAALGLAGRRLGLIEGLAMVATLTTTVVVAFAIGALVPSWYRNSPRTIRNPRLTVAPTEAAAGSVSLKRTGECLYALLSLVGCPACGPES